MGKIAQKIPFSWITFPSSRNERVLIHTHNFINPCLKHI